MGKFSSLTKYQDHFYFVFRAIVGIFFALHGYGKLFGGEMPALWSLMWTAGVVELLVGIGVLLGFFTRLAALGGAITMAVAYFKVHHPSGLNPLANGGELAVLYFLAFLVLMQWGSGKWSLEKMLWNKETF